MRVSGINNDGAQTSFGIGGFRAFSLPFQFKQLASNLNTVGKDHNKASTVSVNEDHQCHKILNKCQSFNRTTLLDNNGFHQFT